MSELDVINFDMDRMKEGIEALTWEEYEYFERAQDGEAKLYQLRPVLARFMVDGDRKLLSHDRAMKLLGKVPVMQIQEITKRFYETMKGAAIPKENASPSSSPIEAQPA